MSRGDRAEIGAGWLSDRVVHSRRLSLTATRKLFLIGGLTLALCIGGNELTSREAWNLKHMGDRTNLDLIGRQQELIDAMLATNLAGLFGPIRVIDRLEISAERLIDQLADALLQVWERLGLPLREKSLAAE